jgi:hypothetical protein
MSAEEKEKEQVTEESPQNEPTKATEEVNEKETLHIFTTSKPKHVIDGLWKGSGNIVTGALTGAAIMVAAPIKGQ